MSEGKERWIGGEDEERMSEGANGEEEEEVKYGLGI
jgi:hypothetical protein